MSVLAGSWDLDGSLPVVVVVAKVESQLFKDFFPHGRVVIGNVEVSRGHTALSRVLRDQVEVVLDVVVGVLNDVLVNEAA